MIKKVTVIFLDDCHLVGYLLITVIAIKSLAILNIPKPDPTISSLERIKAFVSVGQFARTPNYRAIILT
jgi:hypothetical protein